MNAIIKTSDYHGGNEIGRLRDVHTWIGGGLKGVTLTPSQLRKFRSLDCSSHCSCGGAVIVTDDGVVYDHDGPEDADRVSYPSPFGD